MQSLTNEQTLEQFFEPLYKHPFDVFTLIPHLQTSNGWPSKSVAKKQQTAASDEKVGIAVEQYRAEFEKPVKERKGTRRICEEVEIEHSQIQTRKSILLNHMHA